MLFMQLFFQKSSIAEYSHFKKFQISGKVITNFNNLKGTIIKQVLYLESISKINIKIKPNKYYIQITAILKHR